MSPTSTLERRTSEMQSMLPALVAAGIALLLSSLVPLLGPLLIALILGAIVANTRASGSTMLANHARTTKHLLRLGVVLLGLRLPVQDILAVGPSGLAIVLATVGVTYLSTIYLGDRFGLDKGFVTLLAAGFSICGAAAIAAVDDAVRAKERFVALAVAMVTVFGSLMIVLVPWLGHVLGLTQDQTAIWAGASIHEVAQVVAAASLVGTGALAIATTVKLARVTLLAPMYAIASRRGDRGAATRAPLVPWFVIGFACAVALRSIDALPAGALSAANAITTLLLAAGMFGLGMGIKAKEIWPVPMAALLLACASTGIAAGTSLVFILLLT